MELCLIDSLASNISKVKARIAEAAKRAGRDPAEITLVAVTKTQPVAVVRAAAASGLIEFGENRIEEAALKIAAVPAQLHWHMIGHVQSRKAREVAQAGFVLVHSVDSLKLAEHVSRFAIEAGVGPQAILLECNVSGEASKAGFPVWEGLAQWEALLPDFEKIIELPGVSVRGLMTVAPIVPEPEAARPFFRRLRDLRDYLKIHLPQGDWRELSMGMTDDFETAIAEGATLIRVGRALFGERA
jgi:PLP dependent protein